MRFLCSFFVDSGIRECISYEKREITNIAKYVLVISLSVVIFSLLARKVPHNVV